MVAQAALVANQQRSSGAQRLRESQRLDPSLAHGSYSWEYPYTWEQRLSCLRTLAKDCAPNPNQGCAFLDGDLEVAGHTHGQMVPRGHGKAAGKLIP